jgi:hypothetical protein
MACHLSYIHETILGCCYYGPTAARRPLEWLDPYIAAPVAQRTERVVLDQKSPSAVA